MDSRNAFSISAVKQFTTWTFLIVLLLAGASKTLAQSAGAILGEVRDSSGAVVPNVTVTVLSTETGLTRKIVTDSSGSFRFSALPVGNYEMRAEHEGFETALRSGLTLTVSQEAVVNFVLRVGGTQQTVSVTGEAPLVNTTSDTLGGLVDEHSIVDLPLNGRNYVDLAFLSPGVTDNVNQSTSKGSVGHYYSSNGATPRSNNYLLDGTSMVTMYGASSASISNTTLGVDGIREYRVVTNSFSAEYGISMGSQMLIVSKGGTNTFHGSAFEFLRNSALDARNTFDACPIGSASCKRLPEFRRNDFGGSFGGPIRKDKTFFFGVFEALREKKGITTITNDLEAGCNVPAGSIVWNGVGTAPATFNSTCKQLGGATSATVTVSPVAVPFLKMYPAPNLPNNQYTYPYLQPSRDDFGQMRVDHNFSSNDTLFARYTIDNSTQVQPTAYPGFLQGGFTRGQFLTLSENHIFSPTLLNTFHLSYSRTTLDLTADVESSLASIYNNPVTQYVTGYPEGGTTVAGLTGAAAAAGPIHRIQNLFAYSDDAVYTRGRHTLKFGALINRYQQYITNDASLKGAATYPDVGSFLQALPSQVSAITPGGNVARTFFNTTVGFYAQDDYRITSRLTANLGLRYEFETVPVEQHGIWSAFLNSPLTDTTMGLTNKLMGKNPSLRNFGPRLGFAWDVMGDGKTSVHGGVARLYDIGNYASIILQTLVGQPPFTIRGLTNFSPNNVVLSLPLTFPPGNVAQAPRPMDYFFGQPQLWTFNLSVERQLPFDMGLSIGYVGSRGSQLNGNVEGNPLIPGGVPGLVGGVPGCIPRPASQTLDLTSMVDGIATACFGAKNAGVSVDRRTNLAWGSITDFFQDKGFSWYNSMQVSLTKRLSRGIQFQASYTYSHNVDQNPGQLNLDTGASGTLHTVDPYHVGLDQGLCACDVTHNFRFNAIYYIPKIGSDSFFGKFTQGWWVSGILSREGGFPFTPVLNANRSLSGSGGGSAGTDRPDLSSGRSLSSITQGTSTGCGTGTNAIAAGTPLATTSRWYDPCAFSIPTAGFLGNLGRNVMRGPGFANLDISIVKDTPLKFLGEGGKLEFRSEFFNVLNLTNLALPNRTVYSAKANVETPLSTAGVITSTVTTSRQIQFALKILF